MDVALLQPLQMLRVEVREWLQSRSRAEKIFAGVGGWRSFLAVGGGAGNVIAIAEGVDAAETSGHFPRISLVSLLM